MKPRKFSFIFFMALAMMMTDTNFAKEVSVSKYFYSTKFIRSEDNIFLIKSPIRVHIEIITAPEKIQEQHSLKLFVTYENPTGSGEVGYWNNRLSIRDIALISKGKLIDRSGNLYSEIKPRPMRDTDLTQLKPGERGSNSWIINLNEKEMLEGAHEYHLFLAGNHTLPSVVENIFKETQYKKLALTVDTQSNTVTFTYTYTYTYTKPAKAGEQTPTPPVPAATTPDKLNDASEPIAPRLPLGTQVSSLRSCPESGIYECPADAPGVTERRPYIAQGRPMPSAFATTTKPGIAGLFSSQDQQEVETTWTLVAYEQDAK